VNAEPLNPGNNLYILNPKNLRSSASKKEIPKHMNLVRFAHPAVRENVGILERWNNGLRALGKSDHLTKFPLTRRLMRLRRINK
jgi:hypothetical protein